MERVVVVGGGISGLVAARDLAETGYDVLVLEATDRAGGKLRRGEVAGVAVDVGAEAMLNRRPEGVGLAGDLALPVVHPTDASSRIWTRGALRPLPRTVMGAPLDLDQLDASGILSAEGMRRARRQHAQHPDGDTSVGDLVGGRFGDEVVDRLVEPLLGGVYAGQARGISVRAAVPQLPDLLARERFEMPPPPTDPPPVFAGVEGGMWRLADAVASDLRERLGVEVRTGTTVRGLRRVAGGFELATEAGNVHGTERAARVVLATPTAPTARILADVAPAAAAELAEIRYASTALVTLAFRVEDASEAVDVGASGFLVPPVDGRRIKASTFSFAKWDWVRSAGLDRLDHEGGLDHQGVLVLRTSLGRYGEERSLQVPDAELVAASLADLADATGLTATPVDAVVQRWGGGLPQYAVGHLDRVARIRAAVAEVPGLALCGAAYDGVGIPACIASGRAAAQDVTTAG